MIAALLALIPYLVAAFFGARFASVVDRLSPAARTALPAVLCIPYALVAASSGIFRWYWFCLYALLPVAIAAILDWSRRIDSEQRGNWRDYLVLLPLGLAVDLRWFEPAWPPHMAIFNKVLLLDAGIYGFQMMRRLDGVGFDLRLRSKDWRVGLREFFLYAPVAIALGLSLGFLHVHALWPSLLQVAGFVFIFLFIAVPEELYFRGWMQNLLQRRMGRTPALLLTAALFGLSHWNKRTVSSNVSFNWQYVLLAALAGIFYGRAWRQEHRVGASAITHASVDTVWSIWLR